VDKSVTKKRVIHRVNVPLCPVMGLKLDSVTAMTAFLETFYFSLYIGGNGALYIKLFPKCCHAVMLSKSTDRY
jgi:hypothetical protein